MQQSIRSALRPGEGKGGPVVIEAQFVTGAAERVVIEWRNRYVGFVPTSHQLPEPPPSIVGIPLTRLRRDL